MERIVCKSALIECLLAAALSCFACNAFCHSQWTPTASIEIIVAAGPSGGNDRTARLLAKVMQERGIVNVPVVVINKPGAGGVIAQNYLSSHAGSGNYLMVTNPNLLTNPLTGVGRANYTDVTPVAQLFTEYVIFVTSVHSNLKTGQDLRTVWKRDPASITVAVAPGLGAGPHLAAALVAKAADIDVNKLIVVPFTSAGEAMTALLGGHVDLLASTPNNVISQLDAGKVRALGVSSSSQLDGKLSVIPSWHEQGLDVEFGNWRGVVGPPGMTIAQVAFWEDALAKVVQSPEWKIDLAEQSAQLSFMNSVESKKFLDQQNDILKKILIDLDLYKSPE